MRRNTSSRKYIKYQMNGKLVQLIWILLCLVSKLLNSSISALCSSWASALLYLTFFSSYICKKPSSVTRSPTHTLIPHPSCPLCQCIGYAILFSCFKFIYLLLNVVIGLYPSAQRASFRYFFQIQYRFLWHVDSKHDRKTDSKWMDNMPVFLTVHYATLLSAYSYSFDHIRAKKKKKIRIRITGVFFFLGPLRI